MTSQSYSTEASPEAPDTYQDSSKFEIMQILALRHRPALIPTPPGLFQIYTVAKLRSSRTPTIAAHLSIPVISGHGFVLVHIIVASDYRRRLAHHWMYLQLQR